MISPMRLQCSAAALGLAILIVLPVLSPAVERSPSAPGSADPREDVIIVVRRRDRAPTVHAVPRQEPQRVDSRDTLYDAVWRHPNQVFLDTDAGPMPLFTDVVFDAAGNPQPRFPDYFTYLFMSDPSDETAKLYLAANAARWRRIHEAVAQMRETSFAHGFIVPDDFASDMEASTGAQNHVALYNPRGLHPQTRGAPVMSSAAARARGMDPKDIPRTPNPNAVTPVEVVKIWDWRDEHSRAAMPEFAQFASELRVSGFGIRAMGVSVDRNANRVHSYIRFWEAQGLPVRHVEFYLDVTDLVGTVGVRGTPTYLFFDRRSGQIVRLEGQQSLDDLRAGLMALVERPASDYGRAEPRWFGSAAPGRSEPLFDDPAASGPEAGTNRFTPLPPSDR